MFAVKQPVTFLAALLALCAGSIQAATVADTLPFPGTPDWTEIVNGGTTMTVNGAGTEATLVTANNAGVYFGWGPQSEGYGPEPTWAPGSNGDGNYLRVEASFSADAADWSMYLQDLTHSMSWLFAPTGCNGNIGSCYGEDGDAGMQLSHPGGGTFVPLDLTQRHTYEVLLKDGLVAYIIDGVQRYAGPSGSASLAFPLLVIGDGSVSTRTGRGSMTGYAVEFDNAPLASVVVPLPASLPLLAGALGFLAARRFRSVGREFRESDADQTGIRE